VRERNSRRGPVALALAAAAIYAIAAAGTGHAAVPRCNGLDVTVGGATQGPDTLVGTAGDDVIAGLGGDDTIVGRGGDDTICGDAGTDNMLGGAGGDTIIGHNRDPSSGLPSTFEKGDVAAPGPGDDLTAVRGLDYSRAAGPIRADLGSSVVTGEGTDQVPGATRANGSMFADTLIGPPVGGAVLRGRAGDDAISDSSSGELYGGPGDDTLTGAFGSDLLEGGPDDDTLVGGAGRDSLYGRSGNDQLDAKDGRADLKINCGPGIDGARTDARIDPPAIACETVSH
jgi:Ca2+-binding RTX toxin-like protein